MSVHYGNTMIYYNCYQCDVPGWLFSDSRCKNCTRLSPEDINGVNFTEKDEESSEINPDYGTFVVDFTEIHQKTWEIGVICHKKWQLGVVFVCVGKLRHNSPNITPDDTPTCTPTIHHQGALTITTPEQSPTKDFEWNPPYSSKQPSTCSTANQQGTTTTTDAVNTSGHSHQTRIDQSLSWNCSLSYSEWRKG